MKLCPNCKRKCTPLAVQCPDCHTLLFDKEAVLNDVESILNNDDLSSIKNNFVMQHPPLFQDLTLQEEELNNTPTLSNNNDDVSEYLSDDFTVISNEISNKIASTATFEENSLYLNQPAYHQTILSETNDKFDSVGLQDNPAQDTNTQLDFNSIPDFSQYNIDKDELNKPQQPSETLLSQPTISETFQNQQDPKIESVNNLTQQDKNSTDKPENSNQINVSLNKNQNEPNLADTQSIVEKQTPLNTTQQTPITSETNSFEDSVAKVFSNKNKASRNNPKAVSEAPIYMPNRPPASQHQPDGGEPEEANEGVDEVVEFVYNKELIEKFEYDKNYEFTEKDIMTEEEELQKQQEFYNQYYNLNPNIKKYKKRGLQLWMIILLIVGGILILSSLPLLLYLLKS